MAWRVGRGVAALVAAGLASEADAREIASARGASEATPFLVLTGSAVVATDYLSRGLSLTSHRPAVQVSGAATHASGLYATGWASNTRFGKARSEVDLGVGYARTLGGVTVDVGYVHYFYPDDDYDGDSSEVFASLSRAVGPASLKVGAYYSSNTPYAASSLYPFVEGRVRWQTPVPLTLAAHLGYLGYRKGAAAPYQNYAHWSLTATTRVRAYDLSVGYFDTDVRHGAAAPLGRATAVVTIGRSF